MDFVEIDEMRYAQFFRTDVAPVNPGRYGHDFAARLLDDLPDEPTGIAGVDDVVDQQDTPISDVLGIATFENEAIAFGLGGALSEDRLNAEGKPRILRAEDASNGRSAGEVSLDSLLSDSLREERPQFARAMGIEVNDVFGNPSGAMLSRCIDEVIILD